MELTRKDLNESKKEVGRFLKTFDHFNHIREVIEYLESWLNERDSLLQKARSDYENKTREIADMEQQATQTHQATIEKYNEQIQQLIQHQAKLKNENKALDDVVAKKSSIVKSLENEYQNKFQEFQKQQKENDHIIAAQRETIKSLRHEARSIIEKYKEGF